MCWNVSVGVKVWQETGGCGEVLGRGVGKLCWDVGEVGEMWGSFGTSVFRCGGGKGRCGGKCGEM